MENKKYLWLDLLRATAALIVFLGHTREIVFLTFTKVTSSTSPLTKFFYFVSGMGPESVMIFFVLSGFFITKSIDVAIKSDKFQLYKYISARLSRLWMVLIPVLIFGFIFDYIRVTYYLQDDYSFNSQTFFGNLFFMQGILTKTYGSNGALWSLSYEWWFYMFFPFLYISVYNLSKDKKIALLNAIILLVLVSIISIFNQKIIIYFGVWLLGGLSYFILKKYLKSKVKYFYLQLISSLSLLFLCMSLSRLHLVPSQIIGDFLIGISCCYLIVLLAKIPQKKDIKIITFMSNISYSLYAFHFPLAYLIATAFSFTNRVPTVENFIYYIIMNSSIIIFVYVMWYIFERNSNYLKLYLETIYLKIKK